MELAYGTLVKQGSVCCEVEGCRGGSSLTSFPELELGFKLYGF